MGLTVNGASALTFADRKAWALREGNRLWLWPEVAPAQWLAAMAEIERVCAALLAEGRPAPLGGDPAAIALAAYTSGVGPLLGWWIGEGRLSATDATVEERLSEQLSANAARTSKMIDAARLVVRQLSAIGIEATVLKGAHTALAYFPDPACRPMSDIDLLVAPADATGAEAILRRAGFRPVARTGLESTWRREDVASDPVTAKSLEPGDPWTVDLHRSLDVPGPPGAAVARLSIAAGSAQAAFAAIPGAKRLGQPALLLHLAAHAGSGFHNLTLLRLIEIVLVARTDRTAGMLDWDEFLHVGRKTGSLAFAFPALALARRLSTDAIPQAIVEECESQAPPAVRRIVAEMRPASAHRIDRPSIREHYAWTRGAGGWLRRLAADIVPQPDSLRQSAVIHAARARSLLRMTS